MYKYRGGGSMQIGLRDLTLKFNNKLVLDDIRLNIGSPCLYGLVGKNGMGKTSLFKCIAGIYDDFLGSITVNNIDVAGNKFEALKQMGSIIEYPMFYDDKTAVENIRIHNKFLRFKGVCHIEEYTEMVGLNPNETNNVGKYSLGMGNQELGIARALATNLA